MDGGASSWPGDGALKFLDSDDDTYGGSTTAESMYAFGEMTEMSSCEEACMPQQAQYMTQPVAACGMGMASMGTTHMPVMQQPMVMGCPMPMVPEGAQMYCLAMSPDGNQVLVPMASPQSPVMPMWTSQSQMPDTQCSQGGTHDLQCPEGNTPESLEARAAALSAYAAEVKAEARKARAAAAAARRTRVSSDPTCSQPSECAAESGRWADITDDLMEIPPGDDEERPDDDRTTLMFRNLPNNYNRSTLQQMLDSEGCKGTYNLVYLPTDFRNFAGFGYAFVNFCHHEEAKKAKGLFQGFSKWRVPSKKVCDVVWSGVVQGLQAHTERYRNSPVMHDSVPDEYKPAVFEDGIRVAFPAPTKRIRPPRVRRNHANDGCGIASPMQEPSASKRLSHRKTM